MLTPESAPNASDPKDPNDDEKYNELINRANNLSEQGKTGLLHQLFGWEELQKIEAERQNIDFDENTKLDITNDTVEYVLNKGLLRNFEITKVEDAVIRSEHEKQREEEYELQKNMVIAAKKVIEKMEPEKRIAFVKMMFGINDRTKNMLVEMEYHSEGDFSAKTEEEYPQKEITERGVNYFVETMENMMPGTVLPLFERALGEWEKNEISIIGAEELKNKEDNNIE